ncbi:dolichyl-P-Man:Man(5)GlcNAc(2)-PP-dolichol alpha-1,3-mannosyltransferase [Rhizopus azygosporus]|uniref:Dol-P-Man:Man(5)GlcNAc(2)-PP-Dol alpha-1,3-mannosyltransferase n=1 Tax=Rhizopus azygosporus TaxID=86630 RepID=A0A367J2Z9_RHIAZ|nr:dolichyl-P-Man:Man(5)GlcNAc(2)-PP-dolichol alpha-1,3-mannosyltransferase [Rhizopus azygosporus]
MLDCLLSISILVKVRHESWCEAMPKTTTRRKPASRRVYGLKDIKNTLARFLCDPQYFWHLAGLVLVGEFVLSTLIVQKVSYTEIDWKAYMQEVEGFLNGERDYTKLRGDTGPLVYPAGFVYIYSLLYYLTNRGTNIRTAQYMFEALYLINQSIVMGIYSRSKKVPPYVILLLACSKRFHSIFLLRCFNDPVAMSFMYACILAMTYRRWTLSTVLFSCALSIKMNVLLFFPAFGILLWLTLGAWKTVGQLGLLAMTQGLLAYPFLASYPKSYFSKAFEFGRAFDYTWTVNWRMISKETFLSDWFSKLLLAGHGGVLFAFIIHIWLKPKGGLLSVLKRGFAGGSVVISNDDIISMMFTSNLIGILFARSLHYQFYSWYFQTLPYLLWTSELSISQFPVTKVLILATIEMCWLTFPSTKQSSYTLLVCHFMLLVGIYRYHLSREEVKVKT